MDLHFLLNLHGYVVAFTFFLCSCNSFAAQSKLVIAAGGTIFLSEEELVEQSYDHADPSRTLIVYNIDPPDGSKLGEEVSIIWQRANEAGDLAAKIGSQVIGHTWLLESISAYKLQPLVN